MINGDHVSKTQVFIGLGSNLEDPIQQVTTAFNALANIPHSTLIKTSALYQSTAVGPEGQPDYINAAAHIETELSPESLLDELQSIENAHQRKRIIRWGPRTLDLDILLYGGENIATERLTIPHPELCHRNFVMQPLLDLDSQICLPDGRKLATLLPIIGLSGLTRLDESSCKAGFAE